MKKITLFVVAAMLVMMTGCRDQKALDAAAAAQARADSLAAAEQLEKEEVENMSEVINTVSAVMDSISMQEKMIFNMPEGTPKAQIAAKLAAFKQLLAQKQDQLNKLTLQNKANKNTIANLQKMVDYLKGELEAKNKQVEQMQQELAQKDVSIAELRTNLDVSEKANVALREENTIQDQKLDVADKQIHTVYYIVAEKSVLKEKGMLTGGFLSKKRANYSNLDKSQFTACDMREFTKLSISSKKPKLITEKPAGSYSLTANGDGTSTLTITDPNTFWSTSPFLIISK